MAQTLAEKLATGQKIYEMEERIYNLYVAHRPDLSLFYLWLYWSRMNLSHYGHETKLLTAPKGEPYRQTTVACPHCRQDVLWLTTINGRIAAACYACGNVWSGQ